MFNSLADVLFAMCAVIVGGCGCCGAAVHLITKRRRQIVAREFRLVPDEQLLAGLAELRHAVALQRQAEQARDMHVRPWR